MIYQRYPETPEYSLTAYAIQQNLPSSYAWLKDLAAKNSELKKRLVSEVSYIISSPGRVNRELNQLELNKIKRLLEAGANPKDS